MNNIAVDICNLLKISPTEIVNSHSRKIKFTYLELIVSILDTDSLDQTAALLGYSKRYFLSLLDSTLTRKLAAVSHIRPNGALKLSTVLLTLVGRKKCCNCGSIKLLSEFYACETNASGVQTRCKVCSCIAARNREAHIKIATPPWADTQKINEIYLARPFGFHVDHIYPLRSDWVCGLHVPENLQYLSAEENLKKGNRQNLDQSHNGIGADC